MNNSDEAEEAELIKRYLMKQSEKIKEEYLQRIAQYIFITENGYIRLTEKGEKLKNIDKVALCVAGRTLAYKAKLVQEETITNEEISTILSLDKEIVSARLSDLEKEDTVERVEQGAYRLVSINKLIQRLEKYDKSRGSV